MTAHARQYARQCRERMLAQGMTEQEAEQACAEEEEAAAQAERAEPGRDQVKPS